jgi:hypothetical protein
LKNKRFPKVNPHHIFDLVSFGQWFDEISSSRSTNGGVIIRMDNPRNEVSKARKEDLLARTMKRLDARQQGQSQVWSQRARGTSPNGSDEVFLLLSDFFDDIRLMHG